MSDDFKAKIVDGCSKDKSWAKVRTMLQDLQNRSEKEANPQTVIDFEIDDGLIYHKDRKAFKHTLMPRWRYLPARPRSKSKMTIQFFKFLKKPSRKKAIHYQSEQQQTQLVTINKFFIPTPIVTPKKKSENVFNKKQPPHPNRFNIKHKGIWLSFHECRQDQWACKARHNGNLTDKITNPTHFI